MADLCKVGDTVYKINNDKVIETKVIEITHYPHAVYQLQNNNYSYFDSAFGKHIFFTKEEAEAELNKKHKVKEKRELLKTYEKELNEKLNLENHFLVK